MEEQNTQTILVVDDTPDNIDILVGILGDDYKLKIALNGEKALQIVAVSSPDLILLDIMMPGMDGYEVCRKLKQSALTRKIPVIFVTSKGEIEDEKHGFELGAADYITKPVSPAIVKARVKSHLELKKYRVELEKQNEILEQKVRERTKKIQKTQEEQIKLMNELNSVLESIGDAILVLDKNLVIKKANIAFSELMAIDLQAVVGKKYNDIFLIVDESDNASFKNLFRETMKKGIRTNLKVEIKNHEDRILTISSINTPLLNTKDDIVGAVMSFRDISKEAKIDKMKSEFISAVSHELRTPLVSIYGYIELILEGDVGEINEEQKELLEIVHQNTARLNSLINDLLVIENIESGKFELSCTNLSLTDVVNESVKSITEEAQKKALELIKDVDIDIKYKGDKKYLLLMIEKLLSNALKFTKEGFIKIELHQKNNSFELIIQDTGIGISKSDQKNMFKKFFKIDNENTRETGGTGLGLAIAKKIIKAHNASINVSSELGKGTTFYIQFPFD